MKKMLSVASMVFSGCVFAGGSVDFLEVENDVVLFSTDEAKTGARPACVSAENNALWSVSLANDTGRAMYSLILTAMAKGSSVGLSVNSANDCADRASVERANKINITANDTTEPSSSKSGMFSVYTGDGQTKLGRLINFEAYNQYKVLSESGDAFPVSFHRHFYIDILYFEEADCVGEPLIKGSFPLVVNPSYNEGLFYTKTGSAISIKTYSQLDHEGVCKNTIRTTNLYSITPSQHEVCGSSPCVFKEE